MVLLNRLKPLASRLMVRSFASRNCFTFRQFSGSSNPPTSSLDDLIRKYKGESGSDTDTNSIAVDERHNNVESQSNEDIPKSRPRTYQFDGGEFSRDHVGEKFMAKEVLPDGSKYIGEWQNGQRNGLGILTNFSGGKYEGEFVNGKCHGQGKRISSHGHVVEGEFLNGHIYNGQGVASPDANNEKQGVWENGAFTGVWRRKIRLKENSSKHTGICTWRIEKNEQVGIGTEVHWDGTTYEGYWQGKVRHGQGTLTSSQGHVFTGEWREGKVYSGEGAMILPWGDICHGTWVDGLMEGIGRIEYVSRQMVYEGQLQQGQYHGYGTLTYANGRCYMGNFVQGRKHGQGKFVELLQEGEWVNDKFQGVTVRALLYQKKRELKKEEETRKSRSTGSNNKSQVARSSKDKEDVKFEDKYAPTQNKNRVDSIYDGYDIRLH